MKDDEKSIVIINGIVWSPVKATERESEPVFAGGKERTQRVDISVYSYRMYCECGRVRFAKPNTLYEIKKCRVCSRLEKLARRRKKRSENT